MPSFRPKEVAAAFTVKLGATEDKSGKHIVYKVRDNDGTLLGVTHISHGRDPIHDSLQATMARQLGVKVQRFRGMIVCTVTREEFLADMRR